MRYVCHQRAERSLKWNGKPLPLCARCTGFYIAIPAGLLAVLFLGLYSSTGILLWLVLTLVAVAPMALDGLTQGFGLRTSSNELRLATGALAGLIIGADVVVITFSLMS